MAISFKNIITQGLSGKIAGIVFRQWYGKTVVAKEQSPYYSNSPAQQKHRVLFQQASAYAKNVLLLPELLQFYQSRLKGGQRAYNLALADYLQPPVIHSINKDAYQGKSGDPILAMVTDNGKVVSVKMKIIQSDGSLLNEAAAVLQADGLHWKYAASVSFAITAGTVVRVEALDLAGRLTVREEIL